MLRSKLSIALVSCSLLLSSLVADDKIKNAVEMPDATKILNKDWTPEPTKWTMPKDCVSSDANAIARGEFFFHNLSGKKAKKKAAHAKEIGTTLKKANGKTKPFGNCVACHNIEGAIGAGNIGPDLTGYKANFVNSGVRDAQWVFQKIADPRVENKDSVMTINRTTNLFNDKEICDIVSYLFATRN